MVRSLAPLAAAVLLLAGCAPAVDLDPSADAANPDCAEIIVRLPDRLVDTERRPTDAQSTAAWGSPSTVLLRCGVPVPGPTTARCISIGDVDWVEDASADPVFTYRTYGRDPATEVTIDTRLIQGAQALMEISAAVAALPADGGCVGADDVPAG